MGHGFFYQAARRACPWVGVLFGLLLLIGGCREQAVPLSKEAQALRRDLLGEITDIAAAMTEFAAQEDWQAAKPVLQAFYENLEKQGRFVPFRIIVLDQDGITQVKYPPREGQWDFSQYAMVRTVYQQRRIRQDLLYLKGAKVFIVMGPILQQNRVLGGVALGFPEEDLHKWKVSEQEFLSINFNQ